MPFEPDLGGRVELPEPIIPLLTLKKPIFHSRPYFGGHGEHREPIIPLSTLKKPIFPLSTLKKPIFPLSTLFWVCARRRGAERPEPIIPLLGLLRRGGEGVGSEIKAETPAKFLQDSLI